MGKRTTILLIQNITYTIVFTIYYSGSMSHNFKVTPIAEALLALPIYAKEVNLLDGLQDNEVLHTDYLCVSRNDTLVLLMGIIHFLHCSILVAFVELPSSKAQNALKIVSSAAVSEQGALLLIMAAIMAETPS